MSLSWWDVLLALTTISPFICWFFSIIITSWWLHYDTMTSLHLYLSSLIRLAFQCCCTEIFTMLLFTAQQTLFCNILSFTIFNFTCMISALLSLNVCTTFVCTSSSCHYSSFRHASQDKYLLSLRQWLANASVMRWWLHLSRQSAQNSSQCADTTSEKWWWCKLVFQQ